MTYGTKSGLMAVTLALLTFTALGARTVRAGCEPLVSTWAFPKDDTSRGGLGNCFVSNANHEGDNADLTQEVYFAAGTKTINMTKDSRRCSAGRNSGQPCAKASDCPDGAYCADPTPAACAADAHGRIVYFIFDGNPVGDNADLSQELFAWRNKGNGGQLLQLTKQTAYCDTDPTRACTTQRDCVTPKTPGATCVKPQMTDLQVGPNGRTVMIRTTGDLGSNTDHSEALYLITVGGKKMSTALLAGGGNPKACTAETEHPYSACTTDADCGATCGDGRRQGTEQCESAADCGTGAVCDGCTCRPVSCGDGFVDPSEACEPSTGCNGTCSPDCKTCTPAS